MRNYPFAFYHLVYHLPKVRALTFLLKERTSYNLPSHAHFATTTSNFISQLYKKNDLPSAEQPVGPPNVVVLHV